jgi:hypothetical protein
MRVQSQGQVCRKEQFAPSRTPANSAETEEHFGRVTKATKKDATVKTRALPVPRRSAFNATHLRRRCPRMGLSSNGRFRLIEMTRQASEGGGDLRSVAAK